jgi:DNA-binding LytR/AlgR family response regulator
MVSCRNLGEYDKMLKQFLKFFRIHNNKIINVELIKRYSKKERIIEMISPLGKHIASKEKFKEFIRLTENHFEV